MTSRIGLDFWFVFLNNQSITIHISINNYEEPNVQFSRFLLNKFFKSK